MTANSVEPDLGRRVAALEAALYNLQRERKEPASTLDNCPTGMVGGFLSSNPPQGWLPLDGSVTVTQDAYPKLYAYLQVNGFSLTLPDYRDRFPVGAGNLYTSTSTGGSANAVVVSHLHAGFDHTHGTNVRSSGVEAGGFGLGASASFQDRVRVDGTGDTTGADGAAYNTGTTGVSGTNANLPPYRGLYWMIRT